MEHRRSCLTGKSLNQVFLIHKQIRNGYLFRSVSIASYLEGLVVNMNVGLRSSFKKKAIDHE